MRSQKKRFTEGRTSWWRVRERDGRKKLVKMKMGILKT